jgi:hypothetical protein
MLIDGFEARLAAYLMQVSCLSYSLTLKMEAVVCSSEKPGAFTSLHSIILQKIELFTVLFLYALSF